MHLPVGVLARLLPAAALTAAALFLALPLHDHPSALGPNVVVNGSFDRDLAGWDFSAVGERSWVPGYDGADGVLRLSNDLAFDYQNSAFLEQCVPFTLRGSTYRLRAEVNIPDGQPRLAWVRVAVSGFDDTTCSGAFTFTNLLADTTITGMWHSVTDVEDLPPATRSVRIGFYAVKEAPLPGTDPAAPVVAYLDNVTLSQAAAELLAPGLGRD